MNREKTREYHNIHKELTLLLLNDMAETLVERRITAEKRYRALQRTFSEELEAKGINTSIEGI